MEVWDKTTPFEKMVNIDMWLKVARDSHRAQGMLYISFFHESLNTYLKTCKLVSTSETIEIALHVVFLSNGGGSGPWH